MKPTRAPSSDTFRPWSGGSPRRRRKPSCSLGLQAARLAKQVGYRHTVLCLLQTQADRHARLPATLGSPFFRCIKELPAAAKRGRERPRSAERARPRSSFSAKLNTLPFDQQRYKLQPVELAAPKLIKLRHSANGSEACVAGTGTRASWSTAAFDWAAREPSRPSINPSVALLAPD